MKQFFRFESLLLLLCCCLAAACAGQRSTATDGAPTLSAEMAMGRELFRQHCGSCHAVEADTVIVGPSLFNVAERAPQRAPDITPEQYVEQSILQPGAILAPGFDDLMPSNIGKRLSGEELDAIVGYVLSLH